MMHIKRNRPFLARLLTRHLWPSLACLTLSFSAYAQTQLGQTPDRPWLEPTLNPDTRTQLLLKAMTQDEKLQLVFGYFSTDAPWKNYQRPAEGLKQSAGYLAGNPRLGIPDVRQTDAGIGVASQVGPDPWLRTALPSNLATAATWDPELAFAGGQMIGNEARLTGFNVMLAGGINLVRDPRGGRTFEYAGEDPLLSAMMVAAQIRGVQSNHIISTIKHFAFNNQETNRNTLSSKIGDTAARMSDLLAFQMAIEQSEPGSVMCGYNRTNGFYNCESAWLLNEVLKTDWGYKGFVMSDWGAAHSTIPAANAGLDQDSGFPFDASPYFADALKEAVANGYVPQSRLDDMATRILRAMFANGLFDNAAKKADIDFAAHAQVTRKDAENGMVLLKNSAGILPLAKSIKSIAIIGSHADLGVLSGGGSSQVYPIGGLAVPNAGPKVFPGPMVFFPSSPLQAIAARATGKVTYDEGTDLKKAATLAAKSDMVIIFAHQWLAESIDGNLKLDDHQDELIKTIAKANKKTIVVLENGGPVLMPWLNKVAAVLVAWYPGTNGGEAIARVLSGEVNPSGHLPLTFPQSASQLPRPYIDGDINQPNLRVTVDYNIEGAAVGYKWFDRQGLQPLFPFGYGLSYTDFNYSDLRVEFSNEQLSVQFTMSNTGAKSGMGVAQIYLAPAEAQTATGWEAPKRLGGFKKLDLKPGQSAAASLVIDLRLLAVYNSTQKNWSIAAGDYNVSIARDAQTSVITQKIHVPAQTLNMRGEPQTFGNQK